MRLIERLMGKRPRTSANYSAEISAQESSIEASRAKIEKAKAARKAAIEDFDDERHKAADDAIAAAGREIERAENAVETLRAAHAAALDTEAREAFRAEDAALAQQMNALRARVRRDYPTAAKTIGKLVADLEAFHEKHAELAIRGRDIGETVTCEDPEDFRASSPKRWSATWPHPDGGCVITGPIEDAPRGSIKWIDGEPISNRDGVTVHFRGGGTTPLSLVSTVGDLPALDVGEEPYHRSRSNFVEYDDVQRKRIA